jgi:hypothetical protein
MADLSDDDPRHGTANGYGNHGCRCDACKEANRITHARYLRKVLAEGSLTGENVIHGTSYRYDVGCRCDACREAHNAKSRATKQRIRAREK